MHGLSLKVKFLVLAVILPKTSNHGDIFWGLLPIMFVITLIPTAGPFLAIARPFSLTPNRSKVGLSSLVPENQPSVVTER